MVSNFRLSRNNLKKHGVSNFRLSRSNLKKSHKRFADVRGSVNRLVCMSDGPICALWFRDDGTRLLHFRQGFRGGHPVFGSPAQQILRIPVSFFL